jgi:hypothetical protein
MSIEKSRIIEDTLDSLKRKISELHLRILSGEMTEEELVEAQNKMASLRKGAETALEKAIQEREFHQVSTALRLGKAT